MLYGLALIPYFIVSWCVFLLFITLVLLGSARLLNRVRHRKSSVWLLFVEVIRYPLVVFSLFHLLVDNARYLIEAYTLSLLAAQHNSHFDWLSSNHHLAAISDTAMSTNYLSLLLSDITVLVNILFVLLIATNFFKAVDQKVSRSHAKFSNFDKHAYKAMIKTGSLIVKVLSGIFLLEHFFGLSATGIAAFGGVGGLAAGLAAKDLLGNMFGGFMLLAEKPFAVGDWIRSPDRSLEGIVDDIGWRRTVIRTFERRLLHVPNSIFQSIIVENVSGMPFRRIRLSFGLDYRDITHVSKICDEIEQYFRSSSRFVCQFDDDGTAVNVPHYAKLTEFSDSSLKVDCYVFSSDTSMVPFLETKQELLMKIQAIVSSNNCSIPYNTMRVVDDRV